MITILGGAKYTVNQPVTERHRCCPCVRYLSGWLFKESYSVSSSGADCKSVA
ncbi:hypothetical protein [Enterococcus phage vB_Efs25_KEN11]